MLKYLIIPLADNAVSFCHYAPSLESEKRIPESTLSQAIVWAMKENVSVQFVYPNYQLPEELATIVDTIDHIKIVPWNHSDNEILKYAEIVVFDNISDMSNFDFRANQSYVLRTSFEELRDKIKIISTCLSKVDRLNIVINNLIDANDRILQEYKDSLEELIPVIVEEFKKGHSVQLNLLTDRLLLKEMNNCNAGEESITLASDGKFYVCPAFYVNKDAVVGDLNDGIELKNPQLFKLTHSPICRICDSYQCKRCVWLNKKMTREVNTPSRQQCVVAHIERNASKKLLEECRKIDQSFLKDTIIEDIDYLDPFDKLMQ